MADPNQAIDSDLRIAKFMRVLSAVLPPVVLVAAIVNAILHRYANNILALEAFCIVAIALVARYFYQRSHNREAVIGYTRIVPSGTEFEVDPSDYVVMILALFLVVVSVLPAVLHVFR